MNRAGVNDPSARRQPDEQYSGEVWDEIVARGEPPSRLIVGRATFTPGARTAWHSHPHGQVLVAETGIGRTQAAGEAVREIRPGETVSVGAGQLHWHGAAPDRVFTQLAMQETGIEGSSATWHCHVTDAEYTGVAAHPADGFLPAATVRLQDATLFDDDLRRLELARARHALGYLKDQLGNERMRALLAADSATMTDRMRQWVADSQGKWRCTSVDLVVPGCLAAEFQGWYATTVQTSRDDELRAGHPEHFVNHPHDGVIDVIENIGETELPWSITYRSRPAEAAWPIGWDDEFPVRFGAEIVDDAGAHVGYSMRQARDEAGGLHLRVTAVLPAAVPDHVLQRHGRHLAIEYRNWIAAAARQLRSATTQAQDAESEKDDHEH